MSNAVQQEPNSLLCTDHVVSYLQFLNSNRQKGEKGERKAEGLGFGVGCARSCITQGQGPTLGFCYGFGGCG